MIDLLKLLADYGPFEPKNEKVIRRMVINSNEWNKRKRIRIEVQGD